MYCNQSDLLTYTQTRMTMLSLTQEEAFLKNISIDIDQKTIGERALKKSFLDIRRKH